MEKILLFVENFPHCSTASYDSIKHKFCHETKLRITFLVRPCNAFEQKNVTRCSPGLNLKKKPLFKEDLIPREQNMSKKKLIFVRRRKSSLTQS